MSNNNFFKGFYGKLAIVLSVLALQNCVPVHADQKTIMIDEVPYHKEKVEEFVSLWNDMSNELLQSYNNKFNKEFSDYMIFLESLPCIPAPEMTRNNAFLKRFSVLSEELVLNLYFHKSRIRSELENCVIGKIPYEIDSAYNFDDLFQGFQVISVNGNMYPVFVYNIIQGSMAEISYKKQLRLINELIKAFSDIYTIRRNNSKDFAKWVNGWGNYFTKPVKELFGTWDKNYAAQYDKYINNGVDTGLPERLVLQAKNRAEILLYGYINVLEHSRINDTSPGIFLTLQEIDYELFFRPYILMKYVFYAGKIVGIDISGWHQETNNRITGGITVAANIVDIVLIVATKGNLLTLAIDVAVRTGEAVWHICTKKGKVEKLETEIITVLNDELNQLLSVLQEPLKTGILLVKS